MKKIFFITILLFAFNQSKANLQGDSIKITVPNVFTPNNDGINDTWGIIITHGGGLLDIQTTVYNRYGKRVFESTNVHQNWNGINQYEGSLCSDGTYFYVITYFDGNANENKSLKGFLQLFGSK